MMKIKAEGFTLVELMMTIMITGIIGGMVAIFLRAPVQQFSDLSRRADMSDIADTAAHRIVRDVRSSLSNSVRRTGACDGVSSCFLEFIPTKMSNAPGASPGGRYRSFQDPAGFASATLDTSIQDTVFEVLGSAAPTLSAGDSIVIYNTDNIAPYQPVVAGVAGVRVDNPTSSGTLINFPAHQFPTGSSQGRFSVVTAPVTYACVPNASTPALGTLTRYTGYGFLTTQPAPPAMTGNLLAKNVSFCKFTYEQNVVAQRTGLVTIDLAITEAGETVKLYTAAHVNNLP